MLAAMAAAGTQGSATAPLVKEEAAKLLKELWTQLVRRLVTKQGMGGSGQGFRVQVEG